MQQFPHVMLNLVTARSFCKCWQHIVFAKSQFVMAQHVLALKVPVCTQFPVNKHSLTRRIKQAEFCVTVCGQVRTCDFSVMRKQRCKSSQQPGLVTCRNFKTQIFGSISYGNIITALNGIILIYAHACKYD